MRLRQLLWPALVVAVALLAWSSAVAAAPQDGAKASQAQPAYPTSVESAVERRRALLDRRREAYLDGRSGRQWHQPPWISAQDAWMDAREDAMREAMRRRRDAMAAWHDNIGRWRQPWSQWQQDRSNARRDSRELDRLARDEYVERFRYGPPPDPWGYSPY
jgi:hypothetical protein